MQLQELTIKCDNELCDYSHGGADYNTCETLIDTPCPKCGSNLLTLEDYRHLLESLMTFYLAKHMMSKEELLSIYQEGANIEVWQATTHNGVNFHKKE